MLVESSIRSDVLGNERRLWIARAAGEEPRPIVILLDGEYYVEKMAVPDRINTWTTDGELPPAHYVYVSHVDADVRWTESFCNETFASFVGEELASHLINKAALPASAWVVGGLSLTGLAAAHVALAGPHRFDAVIAQSGSFWWNDCWLPKNVCQFEQRRTRFRLCCGVQETAAPVDHGNELVQTTNQLRSNEMMRDALIARGFDVAFEKYDGGHELRCWVDDLPQALNDVL